MFNIYVNFKRLLTACKQYYLTGEFTPTMVATQGNIAYAQNVTPSQPNFRILRMEQLKIA